MRLGELEGIVGEEGGYTAEADAGVLLDGLGIEIAFHERKNGRTAGRPEGPAMLLAQALFGNPTALLLDEPLRTTLTSIPFTGYRIICANMKASSSSSPTTVISSTAFARTPPISTTKPSSCMLAAMTTW